MSTIITNKILINAPDGNIIFDGIDFTQNSFIEVVNAKSITFKNCRVYGLTTTTADRKMFLYIRNDIEVKVIIKNCFFGDNKRIEGNVYNLFELNAKLLNDSRISYNYFKRNCCAHNQMGIYGAEENANVFITNNIFEAMPAGIRLGMKGSPVCKFNISNNTINEIYNPNRLEDEGLVTVQPYGKQTASFKNTTIIMDKNNIPTDQIIYMYLASNDPDLTKEDYPTVLVNGNEIDYPTYK